MDGLQTGIAHLERSSETLAVRMMLAPAAAMAAISMTPGHLNAFTK